MNISSLLPSLPDPTGLIKRNQPAAVPAAATAAQGASPAASAQSTATMRQVLADYDVTSISPNEFSEMVQKLQQGGALSPQDAMNLSAVRTDMEQGGVGPDQSVNLVDLYRQKVQKAQQQCDAAPSPIRQAQLLPMQQRMQWLEKFATGHAHPEDIGLSATA